MDNRKGYKAFNPGLICSPDDKHTKKYEVGKTYEEVGGDVCGAGMMHYCVRALDVLRFYPPVKNDGRDFTEYAIVESLEEPVTYDNIKFATRKLKICKKISFAELVEAAVNEARGNNKFMPDQTGERSGNSQTGNYSGSAQTGIRSGSTQTGIRSGNSQTGDYSGSAQTGDYSGSSQTGDYSGSTQTGYRSGSAQTGDYSGSTQTGPCSGSAQTGDYSGSTQTGDYSGSSQTGNRSGSSQTGDCSKCIQKGAYSASVSTGRFCAHDAAGAKCIAVCWGADSKAKGAVGSYLVLSEWKGNDLADARMVQIDGVKIKADTWYELKNGEVCEARG